MNGYLDRLFGLADKTVLVTGANGQLGTVLCEALTAAGARVTGLDLPATDITDKKAVAAAFDRLGPIDILINNAGISTFEPFESRPEEKFDQVMDVNLKGTFFCIQEYVAAFDRRKQTAGSIVNIASVFGVVSPDFRNYTDCRRQSPEVYGATKAGIIQMTRYFAVHLAERKIRVNAVSPGGIFNPKNPQGEDFVKNYSFRVPLKRMANDDEMVGAVLYLAGEAASYTTGQNIVVDGGMTAW